MKKPKVLLVSLSHRKQGNTRDALEILRREMDSRADTELLELADYDVRHCLACDACRTGGCGVKDDFPVLIRKVEEADALILGSPVYVGSITSLGSAFIQRLTYYLKNQGRTLEGKIGSPVIVAGECGHLSAYHQILDFFMVNGMYAAGSDYWPVLTASRKNTVKDSGGSAENLRVLGRRILDFTGGWKSE